MGRKQLPLIGLAVLAVVTVVLVVLSFLNVRPQPVEAGPAGNPATGESGSTPTPSPTPRTARASTVANIKNVINGPDPVKIVVLGDITGLDLNPAEPRWVTLWAQSLADKRPVSVATMGPTGSYGEPQKYGTGTAAPIEILNISDRPGRIGEIISQADTLIPADADVVAINLGHFENVTEIGPNLDALAEKLPVGSMGLVMVQNPQRGVSLSTNQARTNAQKGWAEARSVAMVDVYQAFIADPAPLATLLTEDQIQPNARGSQIWRDAINAALQ